MESKTKAAIAALDAAFADGEVDEAVSDARAPLLRAAGNEAEESGASGAAGAGEAREAGRAARSVVFGGATAGGVLGVVAQAVAAAISAGPNSMGRAGGSKGGAGGRRGGARGGAQRAYASRHAHESVKTAVITRQHLRGSSAFTDGADPFNGNGVGMLIPRRIRRMGVGGRRRRRRRLGCN
jgi:hypothetical protein